MAARAADLRATNLRPVGARPRKANLRAVPAARVVRVRRAVARVACVLGVGLAFSVVVSQVVLAQNQGRLDNLEQRERTAQATYERLRFQAAQLESPARVVDVAQHKLGMIVPAHVTYVSAPPAPATPATVNASAVSPDWRKVKAELTRP